MEVLQHIASKTCYFVMKTTFGGDCIAQESGSGASGHLMRWDPTQTGVNQYYKYLIYPDPSSEGKYRIVNAGWPEYDVILESNRARIVGPKDSDYHRFEFKLATPPAAENDSRKEWNYLLGVAVKQHFDFASHRYVYPSTNPYDKAKIRFLPVDVVAVDTGRLQAPVASNNDTGAPADYAPTNGEEWGRKLISCEAIPAALVTDDDYRNKSDQMKMSPYYYLSHEQLWSTKDLGITELSKFTNTSDEKKYHFAFSKSDYKSVEKTVGHTFNAAIELYQKRTGEAGVKDGGVSATVKNEVGATLKLAYQYQNQTKTINQSSSSSEQSFTDTIKVEYRQLNGDEEEFYFRHWVPVDRFTLRNSKGEIKAKWDYVGHNRHRSQKVRK